MSAFAASIKQSHMPLFMLFGTKCKRAQETSTRTCSVGGFFGLLPYLILPTPQVVKAVSPAQGSWGFNSTCITLISTCSSLLQYPKPWISALAQNRRDMQQSFVVGLSFPELHTACPLELRSQKLSSAAPGWATGSACRQGSQHPSFLLGTRTATSTGENCKCPRFL